MIFKESKLSIIDNSGVKRALCIRVLGGNPKYGAAYPGDKMVTTIKQAVAKKFRKKRKNIKKGEIHALLFVASRKGLQRITGQKILGTLNAAIVLRKEICYLPFGNRLRNAVWREVRDIFGKLLLMATNLY